MQELDELLKGVEQSVDRFYERAIELHNNPKLRSIASEPIPILQPQYGSRLYYHQKGFYAVVPKCIEPGNAWEDGSYGFPEYYFKEKDNKLVVKSHEGLQEMLHMFPKLNLSELEGKLVEGVRKSSLLKDYES